jgi:hypothetical protein
MATSLVFPYPKDPDEEDWYEIAFPVALTSVESVTCVESRPTYAVVGRYRTPGDDVTGQDLAATDQQLSQDSKSVLVFLKYGKPRKSYAVHTVVIDTLGNKLVRSPILPVTGR